MGKKCFRTQHMFSCASTDDMCITEEKVKEMVESLRSSVEPVILNPDWVLNLRGIKDD